MALFAFIGGSYSQNIGETFQSVLSALALHALMLTNVRVRGGDGVGVHGKNSWYIKPIGQGCEAPRICAPVSERVSWTHNLYMCV